jgi:hydrogenase maturation protease
MSSEAEPVRILGIGSPSGDDQAGWLTVDALLAGGMQTGDARVIQKLDRPGVSLISHLQNAGRVILIDAMQSGGQPGRIQRFDQGDWPNYVQGLSSHGVGVLDALLLARELGSLPSRLDLYGIEIGSAQPGDQAGNVIRVAAQRLAERIAADLAAAMNRHI